MDGGVAREADSSVERVRGGDRGRDAQLLRGRRRWSLLGKNLCIKRTAVGRGLQHSRSGLLGKQAATSRAVQDPRARLSTFTVAHSAIADCLFGRCTYF